MDTIYEGGDLSAELARLARSMAGALEEFASRVEGVPPLSQPGGGPDLDRAVAQSPYLGFRQREILALPAIRTDRGVTSAEVARALDMSPSNAHLTLKGLVLRGFLEKLSDRRPQRYRVLPEFRGAER
jgi:hypothetical protein